MLPASILIGIAKLLSLHQIVRLHKWTLSMPMPMSMDYGLRVIYNKHVKWFEIPISDCLFIENGL